MFFYNNFLRRYACELFSPEIKPQNPGRLSGLVGSVSAYREKVPVSNFIVHFLHCHLEYIFLWCD